MEKDGALLPDPGVFAMGELCTENLDKPITDKSIIPLPRNARGVHHSLDRFPRQFRDYFVAIIKHFDKPLVDGLPEVLASADRELYRELLSELAYYLDRQLGD